MMKPYLVAAIVSAALLLTPLQAVSMEEPPDPVLTEQGSPNSLIPSAERDMTELRPRQYLYMKYGKATARAVNGIIRCESGWKMVPNSSGKSSAFGYCQFLDGTWLSTRRRMGLPATIESRNDPYAHIDACVWLYQHDGITHWLESQPCHKIN